MDDSERSYGYSKDIYHGSQGIGGHYDPGHSDGSYESDGEVDPAAEGEPSPEEAAMHVVDRAKPHAENPEESVNAALPKRRSTPSRVESFTWDIEGASAPKK